VANCPSGTTCCKSGGTGQTTCAASRSTPVTIWRKKRPNQPQRPCDRSSYPDDLGRNEVAYICSSDAERVCSRERRAGVDRADRRCCGSEPTAGCRRLNGAREPSLPWPKSDVGSIDPADRLRLAERRLIPADLRR